MFADIEKGELLYFKHFTSLIVILYKPVYVRYN
jgi:hypothetical protein